MFIGVHPNKRLVVVHTFFSRRLVSWELLAFELICSLEACANDNLMKCGASWVMATVHNLSALSVLLLQAGQCKKKHSHFNLQLASSRGPAFHRHSSKPSNGSEASQSPGTRLADSDIIILPIVVLILGSQGNLCMVLSGRGTEVSNRSLTTRVCIQFYKHCCQHDKLQLF